MLPNFKKILYCTDLSENSKYACRYAVYLACQTGADIYVLYVAEKPSPDALVTLETYVRDFGGRESFITQRLKQAKEMLDQQIRSFFDALPSGEKPTGERIKEIHVCESDPVDEILKQSTKIGCDLIVMGTHRKGVGYTFLGSVSKRVMSNSRIPVMVVPLPRR